MKRTHRRPRALGAALAMAGLIGGLMAARPAAAADPGYYVLSPYDNAGITTVDLRYWTVRNPNQAEVLWPELGLSHGLNSRWTTGVLASWIGTYHEPMQLSTLNWRNQVLLTQGEWPLDIGIHTDHILSKTPNFTRAFEWGPLFQTDWDRTRLNLNLLFDRTKGSLWGSDAVKLKYQFQAMHRVRPGLQVGVQGFGELGHWRRLAPHAQQSHRVGPAVHATWALGGKQELSVQAAWLEGKIYGAVGHMFSARMTYNF